MTLSLVAEEQPPLPGMPEGEPAPALPPACSCCRMRALRRTPGGGLTCPTCDQGAPSSTLDPKH